MADHDQPRTVAELLALIAKERGPLERLAESMPDERFVARTGGWSPKDHLAHVAAWERRLLGEMQGDDAAERFGMSVAEISTMDTDKLNAMIVERHWNDAPGAVREEFHAAGEAVRQVLSTLSDDDLARPVRPDDPEVESLLDLISWDTYKHYPEHVASIGGEQ
jgi:hypothetical protein